MDGIRQSMNTAQNEASGCARSLVIVSLGDSYSSGEGIEPFYSQGAAKRYTNTDFLAHRSQRSWPGRLTLPGLCGTMAEHRNENWFFAAASGAKAKHIWESQSKTGRRRISRGESGRPLYRTYPTQHLKPQLDIFKELGDKKADYVTLTLGGNDAGFSDVITHALVGHTYIGIGFLRLKLASLWKRFYAQDGIRNSLFKAYKLIAEAAGPQAQIIVAGYPRLFGTSGGSPLFSRQAVSLMNGAICDLNRHIGYLVDSMRAKGVPIHFVSVEREFESHEAYACNTDDPDMRSQTEFIHRISFGAGAQDIDAGRAICAGSLHPNFLGSEVYRACVQKKIDELEAARLSEPTDACVRSVPPPSAASPFHAFACSDAGDGFWAESAPNAESENMKNAESAETKSSEASAASGRSVRLRYLAGGAAAIVSVGAIVGTAAVKRARAFHRALNPKDGANGGRSNESRSNGSSINGSSINGNSTNGGTPSGCDLNKPDAS